jgi:hypothetical protein
MNTVIPVVFGIWLFNVAFGPDIKSGIEKYRKWRRR